MGSIRILQANVNRNSSVTEAILNYAVEIKVDLILIQEPWVIISPNPSENRSTNHPSFGQILPVTPPGLRPRTLTYISRFLRETQVNYKADLFASPDILLLEIIQQNSKFQLLNLYNQVDQEEAGSLYTIERVLSYYSITTPTIIAGDFNTYHPWWDPRSSPDSRAPRLIQWIEDNNLSLLNKIGRGTFHRSHLSRETTIDLTLATRELEHRIEGWKVIQDLGSDHYPIFFSISPMKPPTSSPAQPTARFNTRKANWSEFSDLFREKIEQLLLSVLLDIEQLSPSTLSQDIAGGNTLSVPALDNLGSSLTKAITYAAELTIPKLKLGPRFKPWWTDELYNLRLDLGQKTRNNRRNPTATSIKAYLESRNTFLQAVKQAKREHWNNFLSKETPTSIYKAMSYTKPRMEVRIPEIRALNAVLEDSFKGKCSALRTGLFPKPPQALPFNWEEYNPTNWDWPLLKEAELEQACSTQIKGKTPGPDTITQEIIIQAYKAAPQAFYKVFSTLFSYGYHPLCWREATGAILSKNKPDIHAPKSYRVISLLNCLGKILERITAKRLSYLVETTHLLDPSQIGGRLKKSAIDAALLLANKVEENRRVKRKTLVVFLDVKGAFDHVAQEQLLTIMAKIGLPLNLLAWIRSFLNKRQLRLAFNGEEEEFSPIETGIPQGSPVSPILFLIYLRELFPSHKVVYLSYIDDIAVIASSSSFKRNVKILQEEIRELYKRGKEKGVAFDLDKTELLHFSRSKEATSSSLVLPDGQVKKPQNLVRWLGIFFDPLLTFKEHVSIRISQARSTFQRLSRLANVERGLSPYAIRQLYNACVVSVADFGCQLYWNNQWAVKRQHNLLQNLALRKILGVFKTAPIKPMEVEAAIPPPELRLNATLRKYALRTSQLGENHPVRKELDKINLESRENSPATRLERIKDTLRSIPRDIEKVDPFLYPPWAGYTPYNTEISTLSKIDAASEHSKALAKAPDNLIVLYSDASSLPQGMGVGVGVVLLDYSQSRDKIQERATKNIGPNALVYNGELDGITTALELANKHGYQSKDIRVFADNQAALLRLKHPNNTPGQWWQQRAIHAARQLRDRDNKVTIEWVPGHVNVHGNEEADRLAKQATLIPPTTEDTSVAFYGMQLKEVLYNEWKSQLLSVPSSAYSKAFTWKIKRKLIAPTTVRETASSFYQLKIGHGYFKSYLYRFNHVEDDRCYCSGTAKQTPRHLLLDCYLYRAERLSIKDALEKPILNLTDLFTTNKGAQATAEFLRKTKISTRRWILNNTPDGV